MKIAIFFDSSMYGEEDVENIKAYIRNDLMLVAGGGYNTDHIIVEKIEITRA